MSGNSCESALQTAPIVSDLLPAFGGPPAGRQAGCRCLGSESATRLRYRARYVSLYLPTCSSSPSSSLCESIRRRFT